MTAPGGAEPGRPRRTLITGGAGFIGHHLLGRCLARGDDTLVVDDFSTGREANIEHATAAGGPGTARVVRAELGDALDELRAGEGFDEIYHLAAAVGVDLVMADPVRAIETNIAQTSRLFAVLAELGREGRPPRTLLASSSEVYGKPDRRVFSEEDDAVYGPTTVARWSYGCAKAIDEFLALGYAERDGLPIVVARLFNTVGPGQVGTHGMVLPRFVAAALADEPLEIRGDGSQTRCFCDVRDVARGLMDLAGSPAAAGRVFNIGAERPISIRELAGTVVRVLDSGSETRCVPYDAIYERGFEDLRHRRPDLSRIREAIGFERRIPLERTIADVAERIRTERNGAET